MIEHKYPIKVNPVIIKFKIQTISESVLLQKLTKIRTKLIDKEANKKKMMQSLKYTVF